MQQIELQAGHQLGQIPGFIAIGSLGAVMLGISLYSRAKLVRNTHDFIIAGRKLGFGFGVAGLVSVWTWVVGILMPAAVTYSFGLSGLWWFTVPNGLAVVAVVPFARKLKRLMPHGYTISEFASVRFGGNKLAAIVAISGIVFGTFQAVIVNLKGAAIVVSNIFGIPEGVVAVLAATIVLVYTLLGGLWASMATSTLMTLVLLVPTAIIVLVGLVHAGGAELVWQAVASQGNGLLTVGRADAFQNFGVTFTLALITATIAGQEFWNVAWGLRDKELGRSFFWGGALYYPIALGLGVLGLIGLAAHVDLQKDLGGDSAALAPFLLTHLNLPSWLIYLFVIMVLAACKSVVDGALTGVSTITAVDIFKRYLPNVSERTRFFWTRASMVLVIVISIAILLGGVNFVTLLLVTSAIRGAVLIPLILAIIWPKTNATAFVSGTLSALVAGIIARLLYGNSEIISTAVVVITSAVVPLIIGFLNKQPYDYSELAKVQDLQTSHS
jgi:urea-proton symporter